MPKRIDEPRWIARDGQEFKTELEAKKHEMFLWLKDRPWMTETISQERRWLAEIVLKTMLDDPAIQISKLEVHRHG